MLALLGWNPGTEQELFSMQELINAFSLERVSKSGARFQPDKAKWFNAQYMHRKSDAELAALYQPILRAHGIEVTDEVAGRAAGIMKERATFITDLWELTSFFFVAPTQYEEKQVRKYWKGENPDRLHEVREVLASIDDFSLENTERIVHAWIEQKGYPTGQIMTTLRPAPPRAKLGSPMPNGSASKKAIGCRARLSSCICSASRMKSSPTDWWCTASAARENFRAGAFQASKITALSWLPPWPAPPAAPP